MSYGETKLKLELNREESLLLRDFSLERAINAALEILANGNQQSKFVGQELEHLKSLASRLWYTASGNLKL